MNSNPNNEDKIQIFKSQYHHVKYIPRAIPPDFADLVFQQCYAIFNDSDNIIPDETYSDSTSPEEAIPDNMKNYNTPPNAPNNDSTPNYNSQPEFVPIGTVPKRSYNTRLTITYGNPGLIYTVQIGKKEPQYIEARPWSELPFFQFLKPHLERVLGKTFNFCAIVYYPDGNTNIQPHRDKEMVPGTTIAGLSLGAERTFQLIFPSYSNWSPLELKLKHGSLYTMEPPTNNMCYHSIPFEPDVKQPRISLTFRDVGQEDFKRMPIIPIIRCVAKLQSGTRKGELCNAIVKDKGNLCGRHNK